MIKKVLPFIMVVVLFSVSSCGIATAPQDSYASQMKPVLELLAKHQNDFASLEGLLNDPLDANSGITRLQIIELYNIATDEYQITRDDYFKLGLNPLDALVGPSTKISKDGKEILKILAAVTPVEEIQADHQVVLECLETRVAFADELSSSLKDMNSIDMTKAGDLVTCEPFDASFDKITAFANGNK